MRRVPTTLEQGVKVVIMPQVDILHLFLKISPSVNPTSTFQVEVNKSVPRMNFLELLASLGGVLGLMLGLGVLQLVQLADEFVRNSYERAKTKNVKGEDAIFCI